MLLSSLPPLLDSTTRQLPPWSDEKRGPSVQELQDIIERAWDMGFNSHGRIATGGIRGTRKHIGTSEVSPSHILLTKNLESGIKREGKS